MSKAKIPANIESRIAIYKIFVNGLKNTKKSEVAKRKALQRGIDIYQMKFTKLGINFASFA